MTAEANPWALWLGNDWANIERLGSYALSYYVPPEGSAAVYAGLIDGTVDMIATDHAPHLREEKEIGWTDGWKAHTGTPSLQFYLSLLLTDVNAGKISLERAAYITATAPAKAVDLYPRKGAIQVGADADIVLVDLARRHTHLGCGRAQQVRLDALRGAGGRGYPRFHDPARELRLRRRHCDRVAGIRPSGDPRSHRPEAGAQPTLNKADLGGSVLGLTRQSEAVDAPDILPNRQGDDPRRRGR